MKTDSRTCHYVLSFVRLGKEGEETQYTRKKMTPDEFKGHLFQKKELNEK
jgi:hypothetical protein